VPELPEDVDEMRARLGTHCLIGLKGVREAQEQLAEWMVDAALKVHPKLLVCGLSVEEVHAIVGEVAGAHWPGIGELANDLNRAERALLLEMGALA
jgi:hypothetical protein